jgi:hypothetical protein
MQEPDRRGRRARCAALIQGCRVHEWSWNARSLFSKHQSWRSQGTPGSRMFYDPQTAFGLVVLGLLCVAVFYVAARSP